MKIVSKSEFTERHGDPANFFFKGQCYDAGPHSKAKCSLCDKHTRFVYILRDGSDRSVPSGSCCFDLFKKWNPDLYKRLRAAELNLDTYQKGIEHDFKMYTAKAEVAHRVLRWRQVKREALTRIREYKRANGEWLPKSLFELQEEATKVPGKTPRWYEKHTQTLEIKLKNLPS